MLSCHAAPLLLLISTPIISQAGLVPRSTSGSWLLSSPCLLGIGMPAGKPGNNSTGQDAIDHGSDPLSELASDVNSKAWHPMSEHDGAHPSVQNFGSRPAADDLHCLNLSQSFPLVPASHSFASSPRGCQFAPPMPGPEPETVAAADGCPWCILSVLPVSGRPVGASNVAL